MRMAAAATYIHTDSTHPSPSSWSIISSPPWHPAVPFPTHQQHQAAAGLYDPDLAATPPPPPRNNHHHLRPGAARRPSSRRRLRPSRKLPTTYINADPASFRRMVHQATGAEDLLPPLAPPHEATLCRPAPSRAAPLATLDTSALLLGGGSAPRTSEVHLGAGGGVGVGLKGLGFGGGFPTLESWDALSCTSHLRNSHP